ncbi:MAG: nucleotidyl transferase AbiEii/AbiGii toxin family protein [Candidatus Pacebacteria bacterium]|jgi:predicted nucleotidyltransferase component of viral defense system|nr:nucleotidyl transferase AbiEii/AbiGii toxin family protein [Candidatus Paceibacterota bacterium]MBT3512158.1 nucleotidyl transferase AbiEii/AbiGii toxin family protein [Candidatus Paceibacterota bacterium]MBT4005166.1 nucleotidyl transferase AbiEii/AbiGii toxin family protein [Candidatus Paceibacterota bacterium]MBT4358435.1 nucleotidyl transferase AbiEii/AbiGii toxin family protein [Candidatus Paceibacterota bacterium]MBT4681316.1 nucleotidyl transferase AbiEii/AbiGii toxin family protein [
MNSILTKQQQLALKLIADTDLAQHFYFGGGTVLSHYYLQHRYSEDLDFFSQEEFDPQSITISIKSLQDKLKFKSFDYQNSFNRNLYFLLFKNNYVLKLEFTYYPFQQIEKPKKIDGLLVDSVIDIATNKLFTIAQKPRGRDYFDLYMIIQKYGFKIEDLRMKAKLKFDWHVDPLQLASKLFEVDTHLDDPIIVGKFDKSSVINFFHKEAKKLKGEILE